MRLIKFFIFLIFIPSILYCAPNRTKKKQKEPEEGAIEQKVKGFKKYTGFFEFYWDEKSGSIFLEVERFDEEFLYVYGLASGVGSNDLGLDRGQLARERVLKFTRSGPKVLLVQPNYDYRANTDNYLEERSVDEAFATSVWWGFKVVAEEKGRVLIDITPFLLRDSHGVIDRLAYYKQGNYKVDNSRSAIFLDRTRNFPENSEFEATVTITGKGTGGMISSVTPYSNAVTFRNHHSFVKLPDEGFEERDYDIRSGFAYIDYLDFATPIDSPLRKRKLVRHRLEKKDPSKESDDVIEPIIYYLDNGAPEPIRSVLLEGASWWAEAFEKAGFKNSFEVKILPDSIDPLDIRYNVIQWVHRSTRGWSYGNSIIDPRTGEIIKGHVSLGSQRVRQDYLIAVGLLGPFKDGGNPSEAMNLALARLRQLSAHEVGHTLGLMHNFASSYNDRASVMDYPHPLILQDEEGKLDLSKAYDVGIGTWDLWAIKFGYSSGENELLESFHQEAEKGELKYISDMDARPPGGAHPHGHLWDNGKDPADELDRLIGIRKQVLSEFDFDRVASGEPSATLEEALVPMYFMHRYQIEGASKMIGGLDYNYSVKGSGEMVLEIVPGENQEKAISSLLNCLDPTNLEIPEELLRKLSPRPPSYERGRENFPSNTGVSFDPLAAAETLADKVLKFLFDPQRVTRMEQYHARNVEFPSFSILMKSILNKTWRSPREEGLRAKIQEQTEMRVLYRLMDLAANENCPDYVRAIAFNGVEEIYAQCEQIPFPNSRLAILEIERYKKSPNLFRLPEPPKMPDGSPIGMDCMMD